MQRDNVSSTEAANDSFLRPGFYQFDRDPQYLKLIQHKHLIGRSGVAMPFFQQHDGVNMSTSAIQGRQLINFASYNYLGLSGHPEISACAKEAIDRFGTSVSASRIVSGEISLHRELEQKIARFLGVDDCISYVSGHATNVSTIGHLFSQNDLILHDELIHNSVVEGCKLSGAKRMLFRHNDLEHLEELLVAHRNRYQRTLIVIEGIYSMEGDIAELPRFIELKQRYKTYLMVDEAHSIGVLGARGRGIGEHFDIDRTDVDLWMGTLSKSFASCGGYIAGRAEIIDYLKFTSPGFVYSVGMPPSNAAAAMAALNFIESHPECIRMLHDRSRLFLECAKTHGLDTGLSKETPIVPLIVGDSLLAMRLYQALFESGIHAPPIIFPAVSNEGARLRFFITADHTKEQIRHAVERAAEEFVRLSRSAQCSQ